MMKKKPIMKIYEGKDGWVIEVEDEEIKKKLEEKPVILYRRGGGEEMMKMAVGKIDLKKLQ